ncbi:MAG TPA: CBS domain-containing protein [Thermoanaerobaculia bacterium]|nr:CBS domain-containing protein [Thermoanaerobaculia bacterium]
MMRTVNRLTVRDLMTEGVFAVAVDDNLETIRTLMQERNIRHAPVVGNGGVLLGLVTHRDLLRNTLKSEALPPQAQAEAMQMTTAGEVMTLNPATADPDLDIRDAARVMLDKKYGCLPVVEGARLIGIVTESDFVRFLAAGD